MKSNQKTSRRDIVKFAVKSPLWIAAGAIVTSCSKSETNEPLQALCADPKLRSVNENNMRQANKYTSKSLIEGQKCDGCAFFKRDAEGADCGNCDIFHGPVNKNGYCISWAPKA